jgi:hypothetical protein
VSRVRMAGVAVGSTWTTLRIGKTLSVVPGLSPPKSDPAGDDIDPRSRRLACAAWLWSVLIKFAPEGETLRGVGSGVVDVPAADGSGGGTERPVGVMSLSCCCCSVLESEGGGAESAMATTVRRGAAPCVTEKVVRSDNPVRGECPLLTALAFARERTDKSLLGDHETRSHPRGRARSNEAGGINRLMGRC